MQMFEHAHTEQYVVTRELLYSPLSFPSFHAADKEQHIVLKELAYYSHLPLFSCTHRTASGDKRICLLLSQLPFVSCMLT